MEFNNLIERLGNKINKIGIITRAWDDEEIKNTLKEIEKIVLSSLNSSGIKNKELDKYVDKIRDVPSVKFYNLHIPTRIVDLIYSTNEIAEYSIKNQERLSFKEIGYLGSKIIDSNDENALNKFTFYVKRVRETSDYVNAVIKKHDPKLMVIVAGGVKGEGFNKLQQAIFDSENLNAIYRLASIKGANVEMIKQKIISLGNIDYIYRLSNLKDKNGKFIYSHIDRKQLLDIAIDKICDLDLAEVIRYTNRVSEDHAVMVAENYVQKCKRLKDCISYAIITGYQKKEAVERLAKSGDIELMCSVITTLTSKEKTKDFNLKGISIDKLLDGIANSKREELLANKERLMKMIEIVMPKLKSKTAINNLYFRLADEMSYDSQEEK